MHAQSHNSSGRPTAFLLIAATMALSAAVGPGRAIAQCEDRWIPSGGQPTVNGIVLALAKWDPDGAGPRRPVMAVGGQFSTVGAGGSAVPASGIATYDSASDRWEALGVGVSGAGHSVSALAVLSTGEVVAGGSFTSVGGVPASGIAQWNGRAWSPVGGGLNGAVRALAVLPTGQLVVAGTFTMVGGEAGVGGTAARNIAMWDGTAWSPLGGGINGVVRCLAVLPDGQIVAGGTFTLAGGSGMRNIAIWNGVFWSTLGAGMNSHVFALVVPSSGRWSGSVFAAGDFTTAGDVPANFIARWDGNEWSALGTGLEYQAYSLAMLPERPGESGDLVVGGNFNFAGNAAGTNAIARWNGQNWSSLGMGLKFPSVWALAVLPSGELAVGGLFEPPVGVPANFARFAFGAACPADFDCSGGLPSVQDVFAYLGAWFAADPRADFDGSGSVGVQDLFDFLDAWFAGC